VVVAGFAVVSVRKDLAKPAETQAMPSPQVVVVQSSDGDLAMPRAAESGLRRNEQLITCAGTAIFWAAIFIYAGVEHGYQSVIDFLIFIIGFFTVIIAITAVVALASRGVSALRDQLVGTERGRKAIKNVSYENRQLLIGVIYLAVAISVTVVVVEFVPPPLEFLLLVFCGFALIGGTVVTISCLWDLLPTTERRHRIGRMILFAIAGVIGFFVLLNIIAVNPFLWNTVASMHDRDRIQQEFCRENPDDCRD